MKVLVLHGLGEVGSRKKLQEIKNSFNLSDVLNVDNNITEVLLRDLISQGSLFSDNRLIVVENPQESLKISPIDSDVTLLIWLNKELDSRRVLFKSLKDINAQIFNFPESKEISVFPFLEKLSERKKDAFLELKNLEMGGFEFHYLVVMMFYLLRQIIYLPSNAAPFVKQKALKQRQNFTAERVKKMYKFLLELNYKVNCGLIEPKQANFLASLEFMGD